MKMKSNSLFFLLPAACALLALTGCGNKGPLVMPQQPVPVEEQPAAPVDEAAEEANEAADEAADEAIEEDAGETDPAHVDGDE